MLYKRYTQHGKQTKGITIQILRAIIEHRVLAKRASLLAPDYLHPSGLAYEPMRLMSAGQALT